MFSGELEVMRWKTDHTWEQFVSISLAGTDPESLSHCSPLDHLKTMPVSQFTSSSFFFFPSKSGEDKSEHLQQAWNVYVLDEKFSSHLLTCPSNYYWHPRSPSLALVSQHSPGHWFPAALAGRHEEKKCWFLCASSYGERTWRWSPEMFLGPCAQDGVCLHAVRVYGPLWPTLNNTQFSGVGADIFILCVI